MTFQQYLLNFFGEKLNLDDNFSTFLAIATLFASLLIISTLIYLVLRVVYVLYIKRILNKHSHKTIIIESILEKFLINSTIKIIPGLIIYAFSGILTIKDAPWTSQFTQLVESIALLYILLHAIKAIFAVINSINSYLKKSNHPQSNLIKSVFQVIKILLGFLAAILGISIVIGKSPAILLTGLGALSAVLLLVFKDTIIGFTANIQSSAYDTVRIGDWVTIPSHGADGTVLDININIVTVQNFDKTIVYLPTGALISNSVKNWRGMFESGGRRIKRAMNIDISTVKFCDDTLLDKLSKIDLLKDYIAENKQAPLTNATLFRQYITRYLQESPNIHSEGFLMLIRHLEPTEVGLPIEIYAFTTDTAWAKYEVIQADIFDHMFAIISMFELRIFQLDDYRQRVKG